MTTAGSRPGPEMFEGAHWKRATACGATSCVEVADLGDRVAVRDSKDLSVAPLVFTRSEWSAFLHGVRAGDFH